jgi:hypothetical protein
VEILTILNPLDLITLKFWRRKKIRKKENQEQDGFLPVFYQLGTTCEVAALSSSQGSLPIREAPLDTSSHLYRKHGVGCN